MKPQDGIVVLSWADVVLKFRVGTPLLPPPLPGQKCSYTHTPAFRSISYAKMLACRQTHYWRSWRKHLSPPFPCPRDKKPNISTHLVLLVGFSYNKVVAWADVMLELMVGRLFFFVPSLPETLGDLTPNLQVRLLQLVRRRARLGVGTSVSPMVLRIKLITTKVNFPGSTRPPPRVHTRIYS